jgi:hypothetical protein
MLKIALASMKDIQATGEAFSPKKRTSSTSNTNLFTFSIFVGHFCPPVSGSSRQNQCGTGSTVLTLGNYNQPTNY